MITQLLQICYSVAVRDPYPREESSLLKNAQRLIGTDSRASRPADHGAYLERRLENASHFDNSA
jgi:hypothetical protein